VDAALPLLVARRTQRHRTRRPTRRMGPPRAVARLPAHRRARTAPRPRPHARHNARLTRAPTRADRSTRGHNMTTPAHATGDCPSCHVGTLQHHVDRGECVVSCCPECHWIASRDENPIPEYLMEETR